MSPKQGKLIIHIGPPKTGTTSLQYYLQSLKRGDIYYCGTFQPRADNRDTIANQLYRYCNDPTDDNISTEALETSISEKLKTYEYVVLSEEMFLVQAQKSTWQEKLIRLNNLLSSYAPSILFFTRDIDAVLPSYYQEIYKSLPPQLQDDFNLFEQSNYALVYDYKSLYKSLVKYGYTNIRWLQFESMIKGKYSLSDILGGQIIVNDEPIVLGQQNKSQVKNGARILEKHHPIETYLNKFRVLVPERLRGKRLVVPLIRLLRTASRKEKELKVSAFAKSRYKESLEYLKAIGE